MRLDDFFVAAVKGTGTHTADAQVVGDAIGARFYFVVSTATSVSSASFTISVLDEASDTFIPIPGATSKVLTAAGTTTLTIFPGIASTANLSVDQPLGEVIQAAVAIQGSATATITFSLGGEAF